MVHLTELEDLETVNQEITLNVQDIFKTLFTAKKVTTFIKGTYWNKGACVIGPLIRIGAFINKNTFELDFIYYIFKFLFVTLSCRCVTLLLFLLRNESATLQSWPELSGHLAFFFLKT